MKSHQLNLADMAALGIHKDTCIYISTIKRTTFEKKVRKATAENAGRNIGFRPFFNLRGT
jgi:hypothetical protein